MDVAELIYNIAKREDLQDAYVLEFNFEEYGETAVSMWMRFERASRGRVKIVFKGSKFIVNSSMQLRFIMDMLYPNILNEMMEVTGCLSTTEYSGVHMSIYDGQNNCVSHFRHTFTNSISDIYVLDPLAWLKDGDLIELAKTIHMCSRLICGLISPS